MEITEAMRQRAVRILESVYGHSDAEAAVDAVIVAIADPRDDVRAGAEALRRWSIGGDISSDADFEEIAEVVLNAAQQKTFSCDERAEKLLIRALPGIRDLLEWFVSRSGHNVTRDGATRAQIWANRIKCLEYLHGVGSETKWLPQHSELLRKLTDGR
jgi:hypothetical protein